MTLSPTATQVQIRPAVRADLPAIVELYNWAITNTVATFDTATKSVESQVEWFDTHGEKYPMLAAELDGALVGWASLSEWSDRCAYTTTAEVSVYVEEGHHGHGIGTKLLEALIVAGKAAGLHLAVARIVEGGDASIALHKKLGFTESGVMAEAGKKFGKYLDVHILGLLLDGSRK